MLQIRYKNSSKGSMWLVESKYTFGSDAQSDILVEGASILPHHASIEIKGDRVSLVNHGNAQVEVNGELVVTAIDISPGDSFTVGNIELELVDPKSSLKAQTGKSKAVQENPGWSLRALNSAMSEKRYPLNNGISVIGRSKECDISLSLVHLSRKHAQFTVTNAGLEIKDLNSSNGTFVNGEKITTCMLKSGDEISFDTLKFRVDGPDATENETILRSSKADDGMTTVRPALVKPESKPNIDKPSPKIQSSAKRTKPTGTLSPNPNTAPTFPVKEEKSGNNKTIAWVFLVGLGVLFIAYALYSGLIPFA